MAVSDPSLTAKLVSEFVGTFLLVLTVGCNVLGSTSTWGGVSIAFVLMVSIYAMGAISGANFNPAVSVTLGISKSMGGPGLDWKTVGQYSAVQTLAGISAAVCYCLLYGRSFNLTPSEGFGWLNAGLCESLYTLVLTFVVLNVAAARKNATERNEYYGMAIGLVIIAGAYGAGAVSGGCFNPAVALAIDVSSAARGFGWCVPYVLFELAGAAAAAALFKLVRPEDFGGERSGKAELVSEFLGTFVLVLTVGLNVLAKSPAGALSIAAALTSMIYAVGDVSGAHFNPAVTLAILASGRSAQLTPVKAGMYVAAQTCGGIAAAAMYTVIYVGQSFPLGPVAGSTWSQVVVAETIFTFLLSFVVLCVAVSSRTKSSQMFGLLIGSCVTVGGFAIGGISGGSLNPAVSVGIASANLLNGGLFYTALIYSALELAGGAIAAGVFRLTHEVDLDSAEKEKLVA
ncbi:NIP2-1 [Symbiodinium sp. CCMP2592]|nr:NIP2-1 [Symbiodinium sp. CCMP2592]